MRLLLLLLVVSWMWFCSIVPLGIPTFHTINPCFQSSLLWWVSLWTFLPVGLRPYWCYSMVTEQASPPSSDCYGLHPFQCIHRISNYTLYILRSVNPPASLPWCPILLTYPCITWKTADHSSNLLVRGKLLSETFLQVSKEANLAQFVLVSIYSVCTAVSSQQSHHGSADTRSNGCICHMGGCEKHMALTTSRYCCWCSPPRFRG